MTSRHSPATTRLVLGLCLSTALWMAPAQAAKKITCAPDDVRYEINVDKLAIQYQATGLEATLSGLSVLGARVDVAPKTLQQAAVATQKLNEFIKALATGYNRCAISKQAYEEGIKGLLPAMRSDGKTLEGLRQQLLADRKVDAKHLEKLLADYNNKLERLARISGKAIDYDRIAATTEDVVAKYTARVIKGQENLKETLPEMLSRVLDDRDKRQKESPPPSPQQVKTEIGSIKQQLQAKADEAEAAYSQGYDLLNHYRYAEAIPYLEKALAAVKLPDFYQVLGRVYREMGVLGKAERILREGLAQVDEAAAPDAVAKLSNELGLVLLAKGDLDGALVYAQRALKIQEKVYGSEHPTVAISAINIATILKDQYDLDGALAYTERALKIGEQLFGPEHPMVIIQANNIGQILQAQGDLDGALTYTQRALKIGEQVFGPKHPNIARYANNIGQILQDKGDFDSALAYAQRALKIDEQVYGSEHPIVAIDTYNIGKILKGKGDLDGALAYAQRALKIQEKVYGSEHPTVAISANKIGQILKAKGDLNGALTHTQRALTIFSKTYGAGNPLTRIAAGNVEQIRSLMKK